jgi:hypothetical protein
MLDPYERHSLFDALRPPQGFNLSCAVGTTYSTDLVALLCAPLAFTIFEFQGDEDKLFRDPLLLLEALRRHTQQIALFCQADRIQVPSKPHQLFTCLESIVYPVVPPGDKLSFHPKVWLLRFERGKDSCFRLLCATRNLTHDRSWDLLLALDGKPGGFSRRENAPLIEFFAKLPALTARPLKKGFGKNFSRAMEELPNVLFEPPEGFQELRFWPLGKDMASGWPFPGNSQRTLIISPFLKASALNKLATSGRRHILISRDESLSLIPRETLKRFEKVYTLHSAAEPEPEDEAEGFESLRGLHAKAYLIEDESAARLWVGSANSTNAAFQGSFEFLVELVGRKNVCGIDEVLKPTKGRTGLLNLLQEYDTNSAVAQQDSIEKSLRQTLEEVRRVIVQTTLTAIAKPEGSQFLLRLIRGQEPAAPLPKDVSITAWPITLIDSCAVPLNWNGEAAAEFGKVSFEALTSFYTFRVKVKAGGKSKAIAFVLSLPLEGAPADREDRLVRNMLENKGKVLRWLLLLLSDFDPGTSAEPPTGPGLGPDTGPGPHEPQATGLPGTQLFEMLLAALDRDPERIKHVARLVADLKKDEKTASLLPDGFETIWAPIQAAYEETAR